MNPLYSRSRLPLGAFALSALLSACGETTPPANSAQATTPKAALSVTASTPLLLNWPQTLKASGNIAAWQEVIISPELSNYRISELHAHIGDHVKKGQLLARIDADTLLSELAESRASLVEAEATLNEARANHERAKQLRDKGFFSPQQNTQTQTAAETALARVNASRARVQSAELRQAKTKVLAPDNGIISARAATVGSLTQPGQELFRLIRDSRLEWRAEVTAAELSRLKQGHKAFLSGPNGESLQGTLRTIAPTLDPQTRNALVYVDLPSSASRVVSAGMFARGEFRLAETPALTLPQSAVLLRDGFSYVFLIEGNKVTQNKINSGRRHGERIEVSGIDAKAQVVSSGGAFLADGDTVRIIPASAPNSAMTKN